MSPVDSDQLEERAGFRVETLISPVDWDQLNVRSRVYGLGLNVPQWIRTS